LVNCSKSLLYVNYLLESETDFSCFIQLSELIFALDFDLDIDFDKDFDGDISINDISVFIFFV